ncbi:MAG: hypothetical protein MJ094_08095 [Saccharofermentans sp.]|nr:hypothetical protein [Saccharofermentans sp.]
MSIKKTVAIALVASMCMSMAGCASSAKKLEQAKEDILSVVEKHASKVVKNYDADNGSNRINSAIEDTLEYEIDEDSLEIDKDEASIDVVYTLVDFDDIDIPALGFVDEDAIIEAIEDADTQEVTITYELELDDDKWVIINEDDIADDFADVAYCDVDFTVQIMIVVEESVEEPTQPVVPVVDDSVVGSYVGYNDVIAILNEMAVLEAEFEGDFVCEAILTLNADGTFVIEPQNPEQIIEDYRTFMINNLPAFAYAFGGVTEDMLEASMQAYGYTTYEEFVDNSMDTEEMLTSVALNNSGSYAVVNNTIILYADNGETYEGTISGDTIVLSVDVFETEYNRI